MKLCGGGCGSKIPDTAKRCDACERERNGVSDSIRQHVPVGADDGIKNHTTGYDALLDRLRKDPRWQKRRALTIRQQPICARCHTAMSEIVDHIVPALFAIQQAQESGRWPSDKYVGYYLQTNLQGLCRPCHGAKTLEDKAHVGPWPNVVEAFDAAPRKKYF
jgi:5-methylcytosine-specific restriction endonuclease McrA